MTDLLRDYLRDLESRLNLDAERKRLTMQEIRSHLEDRIRDEKAADPSKGEEDLVRDVLHDFGSPRDLALAYSPEGPVLQHAASGETVLRLGRAAARGTAKVLKWTAATLGVLLVVALVAGAWAWYEFGPTVRANIPYDVYHYSERCEDAPCTQDVNQTFYVHAAARGVTLGIDAWDKTSDDVGNSTNATGTVVVILRSPGGAVAIEEEFNTRSHRYFETTLGPETGNWTITYAFRDFGGSLYVSIEAIGLPP